MEGEEGEDRERGGGREGVVSEQEPLRATPSSADLAFTQVRIDEFFGNASCDPFGGAISVAHVKASAGFAEDWQTPAFDEYVLVLKGSVSIEHSHGQAQLVKAGQAVYLAKGARTAQALVGR